MTNITVILIFAAYVVSYIKVEETEESINLLKFSL